MVELSRAVTTWLEYQWLNCLLRWSFAAYSQKCPWAEDGQLCCGVASRQISWLSRRQVNDSVICPLKLSIMSVVIMCFSDFLDVGDNDVLYILHLVSSIDQCLGE